MAIFNTPKMPAAGTRCEPDFVQRRLRIQNDPRAVLKRNLKHWAMTRTVQIEIRPSGIERLFNRREDLVDSGQKAGFIQEWAHVILDQWSLACARF